MSNVVHENRQWTSWSKYKLGTVVSHVEADCLGHITGFIRRNHDNPDYILLRVKWDDGVERSVDPLDVCVLKD